MNNKTRVIAAVLCGVMAVSSLAACSKQVVPMDADNGKADTASETNKFAINSKSDKGIAESFVNALIGEDYDTVISCLNIDQEKSFISSEDIEFAIPRSKYANLTDEAIKTAKVDYSSTYVTGAESSTVTATFSNGKELTEQVSIETVLNENNEWKIEAPDFYNKNFTFRAPSGKVTITANEIQVGKEYLTNGTAGKLGKYCDYTLPYVGKKGLNVKVTCDNYTYETVLSTTSNNSDVDEYKAIYNIESDEYESICSYIKDAWNGMYKEWIEGNGANAIVTSYLSEKADPEIANRIVSGYKQMSEPSATSSRGNDLFKMVDVLPNENGAFYITDDLIGVNFNYKLSWHYILADWMKDMNRTSSIVLQKTNDEYKIYELTDEELFTKCNEYTQDW